MIEILQNSKGTKISDIETWAKAFKEVDKENNWKEGRSAHSLAKYFCNGGEKLIEDTLVLLGCNADTCVKSEIEHECKFDEYCKGRMQDLHLQYSDCIVEIEAKVDETFGDTISKAYEDGVNSKKEKPQSNKVDRIEGLVKLFFNSDYIDVDSSVLELRYQLLHYLAGTYSEACKCGVKKALMPVLVFKTDSYDEDKGKKNMSDYFAFTSKLDFVTEIEKGETKILKKRFSLNKGDIDIYTTYIEIDL